MACKRCGGVSLNKDAFNYATYELLDNEPRTVKIGAKSAILLKGLREGDKLLLTGKVMELGAADAAKLQKQEAPIWIIS